MEISNRATIPKALFCVNTPSSICTYNHRHLRGSKKKGVEGNSSSLKRQPLLCLLWFVWLCTNTSVSSSNSPTRWERHLLSDSYKCLRPFWKTITIQWLENCSPSLRKKKKGTTAVATTDNKNFLLHNPPSMNDKEMILTYPQTQDVFDGWGGTFFFFFWRFQLEELHRQLQFLGDADCQSC